MTDHQRRVRIGLLISAHLVSGLIMTLIARAIPEVKASLAGGLAFVGLVGSEVLLLGMWAGLSSEPSWKRSSGLTLGVAWLAALPIVMTKAINLNLRTELPVLLTVFALPTLVVAAALTICRWTFVRIARKDDWPPAASSGELQFSLVSMLGLMASVALLLAGGRISRLLGGSDPRIIHLGLVFAFCALLTTGLLVWAGLGQGRLRVRVPLGMLGTMLLGLIPPYYIDDVYWWRFLAWPGATAAAGAITLGSLVAMRQCGYRLVPRCEAAIENLPADSLARASG